RIREDESLTEDDRSAAEDRLRELYRSKAYPDARLHIETPVDADGQIDVVIRVDDEGEPVRVGEIAIAGLPPDWESEARHALSFSAGDEARDDLERAGHEALLRWLRGKQFFESQVVDGATVDGKSATFRYAIELGPPFEIHVEGN